MLTTRQVAKMLQEQGLSYTQREVASAAKRGEFPGAAKDHKDIWQIPEKGVEEFIRLRKGEKAEARRFGYITIGAVVTLLTLVFAAVSSFKDALDLIKQYVLEVPGSQIMKWYFFITRAGVLIWILLL